MIYVVLMLLNKPISLLSSPPMAKSLLGRSNSQMTVMASNISFPPSNLSTTKRSSSVLNLRLIMPTT